jgi:hypothetical protein
MCISIVAKKSTKVLLAVSFSSVSKKIKIKKKNKNEESGTTLKEEKEREMGKKEEKRLKSRGKGFLQLRPLHHINSNIISNINISISTMDPK